MKGRPQSHPLRRFCLSHSVFSFAVVSACCVLLLYRTILTAPFIYDDQDQIQTNPFLLSWRSYLAHYVAAAHPFTGSYRGPGGSSYRPLFWLSLALDRRLFDRNVIGFHLTNLLLHWTNGLLLFILMRRLRASAPLAWLTALIWLALPINSEAVAWISGRSYCLLAFFVLLSLLLADRYLLSGRRWILILCCLAQAGALLSHEAGVLVLPLVLVLDYLKSKSNSHSRRWLCLTAVLISGLYLCVRAGSLFSSLTSQSVSFLPVGATIAKYISWMILPIQMSIERSTEAPANNLSFSNLIALLALALLAFAIVYFRNKTPELSVGLGWMFVALLPFSGIVFLYQGMAERYTYLASMGLTFVFVSLALRSSYKFRYAAFTLLGLWALWGAWRLNSRLLDWRNDLSLYSSSLKTDPDSPILLVNLGATLSNEGHNADALVLLNRAAALKPDYALAYRNMGNAYLRLGMYDPAKSSYQKAVELQPDDIQAITNLGTAYIRLGNLDLAEREFRRAITVSPRTVGPYCDLGIVLFYQGKQDEALQQVRNAMNLNPSDPNPYYFLGFIEEQMGARDAARQLYEKALLLAPGYAQARAGLSRLLHQPQ